VRGSYWWRGVCLTRPRIGRSGARPARSPLCTTPNARQRSGFNLSGVPARRQRLDRPVDFSSKAGLNGPMSQSPTEAFPDPSIDVVRLCIGFASSYPPCLKEGFTNAADNPGPAYIEEGTYIVEVGGTEDEAGLEDVTLHCASLAIIGCQAKVEGVAKWPTHDHASFDRRASGNLPCMKEERRKRNRSGQP
jgi:hypothetical protein